MDETVPDMLARLKLVLSNAESAKTDAGYDVYLLVAHRIVEKLGRALGVDVKVRESVVAAPLKSVEAPKVVERYLACGRRKQECSHTRARKPHACGKNVVGSCYFYEKEAAIA